MEIDSVTKQKVVRERTFKVRLSESEYQLLDANNPFGSIAKLLRQSAVDKATKIYNSKADDAEKIKAKVSHALNAGLQVIYCVGESLAQREAGQAEQVVLQQICDLTTVVKAEQWHNIIVGYEPIRAIGTGKTASPEDAQAMHAKIREGLQQITSIGQSIAILYGGSVKPENAVELAACPDINGALVGGASLNAASFYQIAQAFAQSE